MRSLAFLLLPAALLGGCVTPSKAPDGRVQTTDQVNRSSVSGVATAPLRDINVLRTQIPPVLLEALADPYAKPDPLKCVQIVALIAPLDEALGPDVDAERSPDTEKGLISKGYDLAQNEVVGMAVDTAQDIIPLRSWVRRLTGAQQHDRLVRSAIVAGGVRRAYLKGLGETKGCKPPAAPFHFTDPPPVIEQTTKPKYPVR